eukprot:COSAG01_NODE_33033_length_571_cov_0.885593_1_plen_20_part_10
MMTAEEWVDGVGKREVGESD